MKKITDHKFEYDGESVLCAYMTTAHETCNYVLDDHA